MSHRYPPVHSSWGHSARAQDGDMLQTQWSRACGVETDASVSDRRSLRSRKNTPWLHCPPPGQHHISVYKMIHGVEHTNSILDSI